MKMLLVSGNSPSSHLKVRALVLQVVFLLLVSCSDINSQVLTANVSSRCSQQLLEAEQLLSKKGFVPGAIDGCLDDATNLALVAYQRAHHLQANGNFTKSLLQRLRRSGAIRPRLVGEEHVEVDISTKLIYWVSRDGVTQNILPIAIGSGRPFQLGGRLRLATTPRGTFKVYRKIEGWHESPLGSMYYSNYIIGGVAIHGRRDFSLHTTTYGCIAIPTFGAVSFFELMPLDSKVIVFGKPRSKKPH